MAGFSIRNPYFIIVCCLMITIVGTVTLVRMPVDLFPPINIPVVVVATFYSGMPPQQIEASITNPFERFFTLASGVDHIESRSLPGVSLVKIYFQPGTDADSDVSIIANLAMAQLRRLPQGTLPPVVLKFDASSLPVCLVTLKGQGLDETQLHDLGQYNVRNQIANVPGASVPQPFGGKYRQIMVYVDPLKLQAHQLSPMDVVRQINESDLILPAGDVKIGPFDYNLYSNAQALDADAITTMPLKTIGQSSVMVADVGKAVDAQAIQTNIVRVDGQPSVYLPILKQGGDTNTIAVVNGIRDALKQLVDVPKQLVTRVVFDQSVFVKTAIKNLITEGSIGLVLTGLMVLLFLGSVRATAAVFLSIPLSALAAFLAINAGGGTVNTMVLGGLALVFSRLIDNSVIVLENIFRHLEMGESPEVAAEKGGSEVALAVLAATLATAIVFFPVVFLYGVSRFLFIALASAVVFALFASYMVAMTVVPLYCAKLMNRHQADKEFEGSSISMLGKVILAFDRLFEKMLVRYDRSLAKTLLKPVTAVVGLAGVSLLCLSLYPLLGVSFFPRTDAGQFVINLKAPSGTRVELTEDIREASRADHSGSDPQERAANGGFEHWHHSRLLGHLHLEFGPPYRLCPGQSKGRAQGWKLRIHEEGSRANSETTPATYCVFSVGRAGRRGAEPGIARANRHPGQRKRYGRGTCGGIENRLTDEAAFGRQRCVDTAGRGLSGAAVGRGSRKGRTTWPFPARSR